MSWPSLARLVPALAGAALAGCMSAPPTWSATGSDTWTLAVLDARDQPQDERAMPRRPRLVMSIEPAALDPAGPGPLLFEGPPDAELLRDLERWPLTAANTRRLVPIRMLQELGSISVQPEKTLTRGAPYTLALVRSALRSSSRGVVEHAWTRALRSADTPAAGAAVSGTFPASGAADLGTQLEFAALTFDGSISGIEAGIWLEDAQGWAVPARVETMPCVTLETTAEACVRVMPSAPLSALSRYTLRTGRALRDAHGAEVEALASSFATGSALASPALAWQHADCALDETATPVGCALLGDQRIQLRLLPSAPARIFVQLDEQRAARLANGQPLEISFGDLAPNSAHQLLVAASDPGGAVQNFGFSLTTSAELASLSITEVQADPLGSEPAQEFIEIANFGSQETALQGCSIADAPDQPGTRIERAVTLAPGARALLVSDAFDAASPLDTPPAAGALLVRIGNAVTRAGLANTGEPLFLRDSEQHRLSAAPATPVPRAGVCNVRISADPRSGAVGTFAYALEPGCTPGL